MRIIHKIRTEPPICEWSEEFNDYVCVKIQFRIITIDLDRPARGRFEGIAAGLSVTTFYSIAIGSPDSNNFVPYQELFENQDKYLLPWIESNCDVVSIQNQNIAKLNDIV